MSIPRQERPGSGPGAAPAAHSPSPWLADTLLLLGAFCLAETSFHPLLDTLPNLAPDWFPSLFHCLLLSLLCAPLLAWTLFRRSVEARLPTTTADDERSPHRRLRIAMLSGLAVVFVVAGLVLWGDAVSIRRVGRDAEMVDLAVRQQMLGQRIGRLTAQLGDSGPETRKVRQQGLATAVERMTRDAEAIDALVVSAIDPVSPECEELGQRLAEVDRSRGGLLGAARRTLRNHADQMALNAVQEHADEFHSAMERAVEALRAVTAGRVPGEARSEGSIFIVWCLLFALISVLVIEPIVRIVRRQHAAGVEQAEQVRRLAAVAQHTHSAVVITDAAGDIVWVNDGFTRITGFTLAESVGKSPGRLLQSERTDPATVAAIRAALAAERPFRGEIENRGKNGTDYWLDIEIQPLRDDHGKLTNFLAIETDITTRKAAELELRTAKVRAETALLEIDALRQALDQHSLLSITDRAGRIVYVNTGFTQISGYRREELVGQDHRILNSGGHPKAFWVAVWRTIAAGRAWRGEVCNRRKDGSRYWVDSTIVPVKGTDGRIDKYVSMRFDVTAQKAAEADLVAARGEAEAANAAKSEFLANMSHEIRTPMTAILGFAELIANDDDGDGSGARRREYAETIRRNGEHLLGILNDILDLSKIEAGKLSFESNTTRPIELVHEVMALMQVKAQAKGLQLVAEFATPIAETIQSDALRLRQILVNLVGNAVKFTEVGKISLRVGCDVPAERLWFEVRDTGIGMSREQLARLFAAFEQVDTSATRRFGGTGLGLHISKRLAEMLGGDLTVSSVLGEGSRFRVTVRTGPLAAVTLVAREAIGRIVGSPEAVGARTEPATPRLAGLRVLLAEDGPDNQRLISFHLRKAGAVVKVVDNGLQAVCALTDGGLPDSDLLAEPPFDVVITDMQMPEMDGYTATRLLRAKGLQLPVIALTANVMEGDRERCLAAGCDAYSTKPIHQAKLIEACLEGLQRRQQPVSRA